MLPAAGEAQKVWRAATPLGTVLLPAVSDTNCVLRGACVCGAVARLVVTTVAVTVCGVLCLHTVVLQLHLKRC
jgi:hypothetical protein